MARALAYAGADSGEQVEPARKGAGEARRCTRTRLRKNAHAGARGSGRRDTA
jgi:hypothetical protein